MEILLEKGERVAWITLQRPPLNVLTLAMLRELKQTLDSVGDDARIDFIVLSGAGGRAFSAGVDVNDHTREKVPEMLETVHSVIRKLVALPQITIASVRGACLGGGLEIATACDLLLASEDSLFATPEINVGCYPPVALARFALLLGYHRAAEMVLTGRKISASEAFAVGLINRVAQAAELDGAVRELLEELRGKSGAVLRCAIKGLRRIALRNFPSDLNISEEIYLHELLKTDDVEEGVKAFLEKRKPNWSHR